ncbi:pilin [Francisella sp. SYW-9]|uniref:pilin n=1 Tax=Francisella sp. SYW-9 TaxID=2610888 RepID=UPI00123E135E|nr:pilin [Francisella sp. SYW-9]
MDTKERVSFVELITIIALTTILITISAPMYANHRARNKLLLELEKLKSISQYISNESGVMSYSFTSLKEIPKDFHINSNGAIAINTDDIASGSSISLVPTLTSGAIVWNCVIKGLDQFQIPKPCKGSLISQKSLVKSLYDPTKDLDSFTIIQHGQECITVNCTIYKCTITQINGRRWLAQYIDQLNLIQLYKEDSNYLINLYTNNLTIDPSIVDSELLQQFVDESIRLFNS